MMLKVKGRTFASALVLAVVQWGLVIYFAVSLLGAAQDFAAKGRYDFLSIDRTHGLSLAFDTTTGRVVALELPGVAR